MRQTTIIALLSVAACSSSIDPKPGRFALVPSDQIEFDEIEVGANSVRKLVLKNDGDAPIGVHRFAIVGELGGDLDIDAPVGIDLAPKGALQVRLTFTRDRPGRGEAVLEVYASPSDTEPAATISMLAPDTSASDGGTDPFDGGMRDAGMRDAGMRDGGTSDAGPADSGSPCIDPNWTESGAFPPIGTTTTTDKYEPAIAYGKDRWIATWRSNDSLGGTVGGDHDILISHSFDGRTWSDARIVDPSMAADTRTDVRPVIATDGSGGWVVSWQHTFDEDQNVRLFVATSSDDGETWTTQQIFESVLGSEDMVPAIASDRAGNWVVTWHVHSETGYDILVARRGPDATFFEPYIPVGPNDGWNTYPDVAAAAPGNFVVLFTSTSSLDDTIGSDEDSVYIRSANGGVDWTMPAPLFVGAASDDSTDNEVAIAGTPNGRMVATAHATFAGNDILTTHSSDSGATWSQPVTVARPVTSDPSPSITGDGFGGWAILHHNHSNQFGGEGDILAHWSTDDGVRWTAAVIADPVGLSDDGDDYYQSAATDRRGQWIALWETLAPSDASAIRFARSTCP